MSVDRDGHRVLNAVPPMRMFTDELHVAAFPTFYPSREGTTRLLPMWAKPTPLDRPTPLRTESMCVLILPLAVGAMVVSVRPVRMTSKASMSKFKARPKVDKVKASPVRAGPTVVVFVWGC